MKNTLLDTAQSIPNNNQTSLSSNNPTNNKSLSLKSLIMASGLGLIVLSGCQTTTGLDPASSSSTQAPQPGTPTFGQSTASEDTVIIQEDTPDYNDSEPTRTDNPFESDDTGEFSPVFTQPPVQNDRGDTSSQANQDSPVYQQPTEAVSPTQPPTQQPSISQAPSRPLPTPSTNNNKSARQILIEQARQNSKRTTSSPSTVEDGDNLPAFRSLMSKGEAQLRQGQVSAAQSTFTRAQRLAPQSSAVYFYLGQIALKQNQPLKAEAMARRGLVVAKTSARQRALWQVILKAGQAQGNQRVVNEARAALSR